MNERNVLSATGFFGMAMSADQSDPSSAHPMLSLCCRLLIPTPLSMQVLVRLQLRSGCLPFAWVQVLTVATLLLAVASAWAGVCTSGYDSNWSDFFDYAKAKALAKV
jgi:hypothetical protein